MLFHWFVDSLSWRDQTDPALHLKKTDCASICAPIHFEWKPTEWIGSHLGSFLFKLYFFFYLYSIFLPSLLFLESRPAASPPLYISLFFHNLINRKQIPLLWKKGVCTQVLIAFLLLSFLFWFWERFFATGDWLLSSLTCIEATRKEKKKKKQQIYAQTLHNNNNNTTFPLATPPIPISLLVFSYFFLSHSNIFLLVFVAPSISISLFIHQNNTLALSSAQVVRRGIQPIDMPFIKYLFLYIL